MKRITIAIDGFSATGKSTLAKALAQQLDYTYVDSGALYRALTLFALRHGMLEEPIQSDRLIHALNQIDLRFEKMPSGDQALFLDGENVEADIRSMAVSSKVSQVAKIPQLRHYLLGLQRAMGARKGVVMDGRDIGTVVFPNAELKLFMTAPAEIRARRRYDQLLAQGQNPTLDAVLDNIKRRDQTDAARRCAPLRKAEDAIQIDNAQLSETAQLRRAFQLAARKIGLPEDQTKD